MSGAYYNEWEPYAAQWLRNLIARGLIAQGDVDERSITDVRPDDLRGYTQCHFFAGIGGWALALRLAGWPDDRPVWTGSCPCQPFSVAGKQRGSEDERHLWPAFFRLIRECRPAIVFGEQVAGAAGYAWWDHVAADLEAEGYAAAAADIGAHSVGAPHIRQRLYWVADASSVRRHELLQRRFEEAQGERRVQQFARVRADGSLADAGGARPLLGQRDRQQKQPEQPASHGHDADGCGAVCGMGDAYATRWTARQGCAQSTVAELGIASQWRDLVWLPCADGKARPTQPGLFPLAHGISGRVGRLRAYGNAIVAPLAAEFIKAYQEC